MLEDMLISNRRPEKRGHRKHVEPVPPQESAPAIVAERAGNFNCNRCGGKFKETGNTRKTSVKVLVICPKCGTSFSFSKDKFDQLKDGAVLGLY